MKKLLFNIIGILSKDPRAVQVSSNTVEDTVSQKKKKSQKIHYLAVYLTVQKILN